MSDGANGGSMVHTGAIRWPRLSPKYRGEGYSIGVGVARKRESKVAIWVLHSEHMPSPGDCRGTPNDKEDYYGWTYPGCRFTLCCLH